MTDDRTILINLLLWEEIIKSILFAYTPQVGLHENSKNELWQQMDD